MSESHWGHRGEREEGEKTVYLPGFSAQVWQLDSGVDGNHECLAPGHREETSDPSHLRPERPL